MFYIVLCGEGQGRILVLASVAIGVLSKTFGAEKRERHAAETSFFYSVNCPGLDLGSFPFSPVLSNP